ncbi:hypothetical protein BDZ89DRAFT_956350 [Hymenopellis radicata]|nr:hypothetical protein BDZ89DRAFT_956350 [Hymenopellis radicata]
MEYRYWSFMESHPAHETIPAHVKAEAMDVLTWAWTERLLPSQRTIPAPFSQDECQELMTLIRSFGGNAGMQGVIQTRIIARILLRVLHWRQMNFRPNKPLPKVSSNTPPLPARRNPIRKVMVDFFISCLCLGIPYLFYTRSHFHRMDEEGGIRSAGPMLIIGACTCLVAAIVLSASVTFLSLPGLDNIARVAGLIAVLFSAFSMASTVVALFKYKADAERAVSVVGAEGFLMVSRRHVVFSLPLVFLSYAIIGFIAGLVLYSFRGLTLTNTAVLEHRFQEYTSWTVVGVLGGLLGVLTTSILLMRR